MTPVTHTEENIVFHPPKGMDNCSPLSCKVTEHGIESMWEMSDEELWDLIKSKRVVVLVCCAGAPPPIWIGVVKP